MRILLSGATGAMGKNVQECVTLSPGDEIVCGYDAHADTSGAFPIVTDLAQAPTAIDVIIDFSVHQTALALAQFARTRRLPLVVATTGHTEAELAALKAAAADVAVFLSGNYSLGVYVLKQLTEMATRMLPGWDIEIVEAHHHHKVDAPSGTAQMLVAAAQTARPQLRENYGRHGLTGARAENEIGVHSLRGGSIVGEHQVLFAGPDEVIELKHTALSKRIFALGALQAAGFLLDKPAGLYQMDALLAH